MLHICTFYIERMQKMHYYFCSNNNWNVIFGAYVIMPNGDKITKQILVGMNQLKGKANLSRIGNIRISCTTHNGIPIFTIIRIWLLQTGE